MTPLVAAEMIEGYVKQARRVRPADHRNPHAFAEDMSDFIAEMLADAKRLRSMVAVPRPAPNRQVGEIATGSRSVGRREVSVVRRARRA